MHPISAPPRERIKEFLDAELTIILDASGTPNSRLKARFLSKSGGSLKVQTASALGERMQVSLAGQIETAAGREPILGKFRVRSSKLAGLGRYDIELTPEFAARDSAPPPSPAEEDVDHYEVLQVSRKADTDTIRRVFHVLAQRYHPDNTDTGNDEKFRQVVEAHSVLCDPERRAAHDVKLAVANKTRLKIFDSLQSTQGVQAEIRKREGVLRLLYTKRLTDPHQPSMRGREFEDLLECPLEHLEFCLWFLKETGLISRSDNNRFEITSRGVQSFEDLDSGFAKKPYISLPAPAQAAG